MAQISCQVFLNQTTYYYITYYIALIVGINLNAVILIVGFMLLDLKSMISTLNITQVNKNRSLMFWLAIFIIAITDLPVFVCYFRPEFTVK
jgi:ABC-type iron transport system FetAB permease component